MISGQGTVRSRRRTGTGGQPGHAQPLGGIREPWINAGVQGPEFLLDFRADSEYESLRLLASSAVAALARGAGPALDCALSLARRGQTTLTVGTTECGAGIARWDQSQGDGPVSQAMTGRLAIIANNYSRDPRWPGFRAPFRDVAYRVIMGQNRCSYEDAFNILAKASSHRNLKARVAADTILKDLPGGPPATHFKG